ncbi:MAG: DUF2877 domain-containing protein [Tissierellales bacterium]
MNASAICSELYKIIHKQQLIGRVHSVFDSSLNILDENGQLITFLNPNKPMSPNAIKVEENISFLDLSIKQGQELTFSKEFAIDEKGKRIICYNKATLWDKSPTLFEGGNLFRDTLENVSEKLNNMGIFILREGKKYGIVPLLRTLESRIEGIELLLDEDTVFSKKEEFIKERFLSFIDSYINEDIEEISQGASKIVGYGIGLTPSMDDFLSGIMLSRIYLSSYLHQDMDRAYEINKAIIKHIINKTTLVSQEMMTHSSRGDVNEDLRNLMLSFLTDRYTEGFNECLKRVADFGATSGTDMISGIYVGSLIMLLNIRR